MLTHKNPLSGTSREMQLFKNLVDGDPEHRGEDTCSRFCGFEMVEPGLNLRLSEGRVSSHNLSIHYLRLKDRKF